MSSSDSDDDCYSNIAQKLQNLKNKCPQIESSKILNESSEIDELVKKAGIGAKTEPNLSESVAENVEIGEDNSFNLSDDPELDRLIAASSYTIEQSSKRVTRASSKRTKKSESVQEVSAPSKRKSDESDETSGRRGRGRSKRNQAKQNESTDSVLDSSSSRGRGARGQTPRGRRGRGRNRARNNYFSIFNPFFNRLPQNSQPQYPTYSVGNTDEYPDECESQSLFSKKPQQQNEVVVIDENDPLDDNEELSVKVYWQSSEFFKFTIRKYQKITSIFDYFSRKENVSHDKLLFTFNDTILKSDDTPDSINYNIAKFIDGGIVNQSVSKLVTKDKNVTNGIKLKFQCQNVKKPFETVIGSDEKLSVAMLKCAEYFEKPIDKLRFEFDGDTVSGKNTAQDLELEGGECIDVKILS